MSTVNKRIADKIIEGDGYYYDDPRVIAIVEYNNMFNGATAYKLCYNEAHIESTFASPACFNPRIVFDVRSKGEDK